MIIKIQSWLTELKTENPKRINWFECELERHFPEFKEWVTEQKAEKKEQEFLRSRDAETVT